MQEQEVKVYEPARLSLQHHDWALQPALRFELEDATRSRWEW